MDSRRRGEELNQISRLLFDEAATNWYLGAALEVLAGVLGATLSLVGVSGDGALVGAVVGLVLLGGAYYLRLRFEDQYDTAETMRRQSVLTEALDWPVSEVQTSEWRRKAGRRILARFKLQPRDQDYYATQEGFGARRLAEMTGESAFYTRHLYGKLQRWVWGLFLGALVLSALVITLPSLHATSNRLDTRIASAVYLVLPIVLTLDLLGWALRLGRLIDAIREIEADLERLVRSGTVDERQVMRLVAEYNCQVVHGFPVLNWLFDRWHDEIRQFWHEHRRSH